MLFKVADVSYSLMLRDGKRWLLDPDGLTNRTWSCCRRICPCGMLGCDLKPIEYCLSSPIIPGMLPCMPDIMPV